MGLGCGVLVVSFRCAKIVFYRESHEGCVLSRIAGRRWLEGNLEYKSTRVKSGSQPRRIRDEHA